MNAELDWVVVVPLETNTSSKLHENRNDQACSPSSTVFGRYDGRPSES